MRKNSTIILIALFSLMLIWSFSISAGNMFGKIEDPGLPKSWFEIPKTASQLGIKNYDQAPMLDQKVKNGELPSVKERLPEDPPVIHPFEKIGEYGGTLDFWTTSLGNYLIQYNYLNYGGIRTTPDGNFIPWFVKDWEYSNDYKDFTIQLRKGLRWSDGELFTTEDIMYWWKHEAHNLDLHPIPPEKWKPSLMDVTQEDKWTVTYHYGKSVPNLHGYFTFRLGIQGAIPSHYMKKFHPDFVGKDSVKEMANKVGLDTWYDFYQRVRDDSVYHPEYENVRPVLGPYIAEKRTENTLIFKRNPYFPFVDREGNQLPYIDKIRNNKANSEKMVVSKIATGEGDFQESSSTNIPLFKKNEKKENYETLFYNYTYGGMVNIQINQSTKKDKLRDIFQDVRFRRAFSLGIDREKLNNKVFYGQGVPAQATAPITSDYHKEKYMEAYADYNPEKARKLLDEIGMKDVNGDGFRETPNGEKFNPTLLYGLQSAALEFYVPILELVREDLIKIGINLDLKQVSYELLGTRQDANNFEISCWIGSSTTMFGKTSIQTLKEYAPVGGAWNSQWGGWANWYDSDGEEGVEPPQKVRKLIEYAETAQYSPDKTKREKALDKLLKAQAENLWIIGTVSTAPWPVVKSSNLHNVPEKGHYDWQSGFFQPYRPEQFYFEE